MYAQDESQQRTELRLAFLRHLPKRIEALCRRARRFCEEGWDINGLTLLHEDVQRLAGASGRYGALEASEQLLMLETLLGELADTGGLPDVWRCTAGRRPARPTSRRACPSRRRNR